MTAAALAEVQTGDDEAEPGAAKLFEIPPIQADKAKPTLIQAVVSGPIPLDLSQLVDVEFYNALEPGKLITREVTFFVKGAKKTHRRDADGNVDAVVETKSLIIDGVKIVED